MTDGTAAIRVSAPAPTKTAAKTAATRWPVGADAARNDQLAMALKVVMSMASAPMRICPAAERGIGQVDRQPLSVNVAKGAAVPGAGPSHQHGRGHGWTPALTAGAMKSGGADPKGADVAVDPQRIARTAG